MKHYMVVSVEHLFTSRIFVKETKDMVMVIWDRLKVTFDRKKSYTDLKRQDIEFVVGDKVFLKVSPWIKILEFGWKEKLSHRLIGPYEITKRVGLVA